MATEISVNVAAENVKEDDSSDSDVNSSEHVINHPYEPDIMKSRNCSDDISTGENDVPQLLHAPLNKECIPVDNSQISVRAKRGRKRQKEFTRSENKKRRNSGLSCIGTTQKFPAKMLKKSCDCKRLKCDTKISEQRRKTLFTVYWELGDINKQRQFIINCVSKHNKERKRTKSDNSRRNSSLKYCFCIDDVEVEVCKIFFLNTLSISETTVTTALKKGANGVVEDDNRGKTKRNDKQMKHRKKELRQHILSLLQVPSHYCRSSSNLLSLSSELTLSKMYDMYKEVCKEKETQPLSYTIYWQTFQSMNLSFHCPQKDRCETCEKFRNLNIEEQEKEAEKFEVHCEKAEENCEIKTTLKQEN
ncbi:uncharacterized protein LOC115219916 [Octopus sinensis]|uniref:Uncharacterized protein LOC115219916 n=1 Tax=Octopus sinensis TaxID=2607531 RepID=A0A7E6FEW3_9MOLL|nr:uncharacterized protein LOC115219916 [Octopus sinensis]